MIDVPSGPNPARLLTLLLTGSLAMAMGCSSGDPSPSPTDSTESTESEVAATTAPPTATQAPETATVEQATPTGTAAPTATEVPETPTLGTVTGTPGTKTQAPGTGEEPTATGTPGEPTPTTAAGTTDPATPTDISGTPEPSTPTNPTGTGDPSTATPAQETATPGSETNIQGTPTQVGDTPTQVGDTPTQAGNATPTTAGTDPQATATPDDPTTPPEPTDTQEPTATPTPTQEPIPQLTVFVTDAKSGEGLAEASVYLGDELAGATDDTGHLTFELPAGELPVVSAYKDDFHIATILGTRSTEVTVPLREVEFLGYITGDVDFSEMEDLRAGRLRLGLVTRSVFESPVALDFGVLIADFRSVELCGISLTLPANFVGAIPACDPVTAYQVPGLGGTYSAFGYAGDLPYLDAITALSEPDFYKNLGELFASFQDSLDEFAWDAMQDITIQGSALTTDIDPVLRGETNISTTVSQPDLPDGVEEEELPLVFMMADMGSEGYLPIGLAGGNGAVDVYHAPLSDELTERPIIAMSMAGEGGVGSGGSYTASMQAGTVAGESITLPDYLTLIHQEAPDADNRIFPFFAVDEVEVYHSIFRFRIPNPDVQWDVYQLYGSDTLNEGGFEIEAGSEVLLRLPNIDVAPALDDVDWTLSAYDLSTSNFENMASGGGQDLSDVSFTADRMTRDFAEHLLK